MYTCIHTIDLQFFAMLFEIFVGERNSYIGMMRVSAQYYLRSEILNSMHSFIRIPHSTTALLPALT